MKILIAIGLAVTLTGCANLGPAMRDLGAAIGRAGEPQPCGSAWNPCHIQVNP